MYTGAYDFMEGVIAADVLGQCSANALVNRPRLGQGLLGMTDHNNAHEMLWMPACTLAVTCPPVGVASYKLKYKIVADGTVETFNQGWYKMKLVRFLKNHGILIDESKISLTLTPGSVNVEAEVTTESTLDKEMILQSLGNLSATDATSVFGLQIHAVAPIAVATTASPSGSSAMVIIAVICGMGAVFFFVIAILSCAKGSPSQTGVAKARPGEAPNVPMTGKKGSTPIVHVLETEKDAKDTGNSQV